MNLKVALSAEELQQFLSANFKWKIEEGMLCRTFEAPNFLAGVNFVSSVAKVAEAADHHPDIDIRWRKVTLRFVTHDAGNAVTKLDTKLALECDDVFSKLTQ
jgi:4a-hydroxytetrahydrobiopterin dehydratase